MEKEIKELEPMKAYKYLGVEQNHNIELENEKEKFKKEYVRRLRLIFSTELSAKKQNASNWIIGSTSTKI
jgi:hypothetical protein